MALHPRLYACDRPCLPRCHNAAHNFHQQQEQVGTCNRVYFLKGAKIATTQSFQQKNFERGCGVH